MLSIEPPSPRSIEERPAAATRPAVRALEAGIGGERRQPDDPPGEPRQVLRPRRAWRSDRRARARPTARRPPRRARAARSAAPRERRRAHRRCACRRPSRRRAATRRRAPARGCFRRSAPGDAGEPRADGKDLDRVGGARPAHARRRRCASVRSFIEPDTSMSRTIRRCRSRRLRRRRRMNSPALRIASRNMRRASVPGRRARRASDSRAAAARAPAASRAKRRKRLVLAAGAKRRADKPSRRAVALAPNSWVSSPKIGSGPPAESSAACRRFLVAQLPPPIRAPSQPRKCASNSASNSAKRSGGGASVACAARRISPIPRRAQQLDRREQGHRSARARRQSPIAAAARRSRGT